MSQSKKASLAETVSSTIIGYVVALLAQTIILPAFGLEVSTASHFGIAAAFTVVSIIRGYCVRRLFNWIQTVQRKEAVSKESFTS